MSKKNSIQISHCALNLPQSLFNATVTDTRINQYPCVPPADIGRIAAAAAGKDANGTVRRTMGGLISPLVGWGADQWGVSAALQILWVVAVFGAIFAFLAPRPKNIN